MKLRLLPLAVAILGAVSARPSEESLESKVAKESQQVDHAFLMDCTGSMGSYIATAKEKILGLVKDLKTKYPNMKLRLAFIGYRDITDWGPEEKQYIFVPFTDDHEAFKTQIMSVQAHGGGDFPEDVWIGLKAGVELDWQSNVRMMTLLSDAPHNEGKGRKKYADFKPILQKLANTGKDLPFYFNFFKIGSGADGLGEELKSMIPENMKFIEDALKIPVSKPYFPGRPYPMARDGGRSFASKVMSKGHRYSDAGAAIMRAPAPDSESSYMSKLSSYIGKAVEETAAKIKEEHATEA